MNMDTNKLTESLKKKGGGVNFVPRAHTCDFNQIDSDVAYHCSCYIYNKLFYILSLLNSCSSFDSLRYYLYILA
jgi:hypothetical protein